MAKEASASGLCHSILPVARRAEAEQGVRRLPLATSIVALRQALLLDWVLGFLARLSGQ